MITRAEAKAGILEYWSQWRVKNVSLDKRANGTDGLMFFMALRTEHPELFDFEYSGDKWQIVHAWLLPNKVSD